MQSAMDALFAALFAAGLASGVHCIAMCGGIVAVFDAARVIPIRAKPAWGRRMVFNLGRISTYSVAGAGRLLSRIESLGLLYL